MWFKQVRILQLAEHFRCQPQDLSKKLEPLAFTPCLPSLSFSQGWVSPVNEDNAPLAQTINGYTMLCFQVEEKILPASYVNQELQKKVKEIEAQEVRKVRYKEKVALKEELVATLLPRAFSKMTRIYAYLDPENNWLIVGTNNEKRIEQFRHWFTRSLNEELHPLEMKKLAPTLTQWLKNQTYSSLFAIEKACLLQDPNQQNRVIRCQHQDLLAPSVQAFIKDGCQVVQLALSWHDRVNFVLSDNFSLSGLKYQDELVSEAKDLEAETAQQKFIADFLIMSGTLTALLKDLREALLGSQEPAVLVPLTKAG
jgi:recombination associated protein RdgC